MTKSKIRLIFALALVVVVLIFALQNVAPVEVQFLLWGFALPRALLIFLLLVVGVIVGWFLRGAMHRSAK